MSARREADERPEHKQYADIKEWLLAPEARTENLVGERPRIRLRPPPTFDD